MTMRDLPVHYEYRRFDGYPRPRRLGLILTLAVILAGVVWIDLYDVPHGLRSLACDVRVTPWREIFASPKFYWGLPILLAEMAFWIRVLIWIWPVPDLSRPTLSDWALVILVFLLGTGISLFAIAALQPAPWHACL
jgi:hypothetical protein